jgi:hypothetical protein
VLAIFSPCLVLTVTFFFYRCGERQPPHRRGGGSAAAALRGAKQRRVGNTRDAAAAEWGKEGMMCVSTLCVCVLSFSLSVCVISVSV